MKAFNNKQLQSQLFFLLLKSFTFKIHKTDVIFIFYFIIIGFAGRSINLFGKCKKKNSYFFAGWTKISSGPQTTTNIFVQLLFYFIFKINITKIAYTYSGMKIMNSGYRINGKT